MEEIEILKHKNQIVKSENYKSLRNYQINMILGLANSQIEPLELKGMLKLISKTDSWESEYEKQLKKLNKE